MIDKIRTLSVSNFISVIIRNASQVISYRSLIFHNVPQRTLVFLYLSESQDSLILVAHYRSLVFLNTFSNPWQSLVIFGNPQRTLENPSTPQRSLALLGAPQRFIAINMFGIVWSTQLLITTIIFKSIYLRSIAFFESFSCMNIRTVKMVQSQPSNFFLG